ncbi:MAG: hypothetical protein H7Y31_13755 [Chitinophagaceae bacterium]|nr:hypothetical protein [Chitinophagaceae bacterium]
MPEKFTINISELNDRSFYAELRVFGYTHKIAVIVNDVEIIFEPDEERNYRAVVSETAMNEHRIDRNIIAAIAAELETNFK